MTVMAPFTAVEAAVRAVCNDGWEPWMLLSRRRIPEWVETRHRFVWQAWLYGADPGEIAAVLGWHRRSVKRVLAGTPPS